MMSADLRSVGVIVFHLLARSRKSLAPVARAVHATFELKYGLEKVIPPDHGGASLVDFRWRTALAQVKARAAAKITEMPANRGAHLHMLRYDVLDEISLAARDMVDIKTSLAVFRIREREFRRFETAVTIEQITRKPLQAFTQ